MGTDMLGKLFIGILILVVVDIITGITAAIVEGWDYPNDPEKGFKSSSLRKGLVHKMTYAVAFVVAWVIDYFIGSTLDLGYVSTGLLIVLVATYVTITEVSSILENICKINPELADNEFMRIFARNVSRETGIEGVSRETAQSADLSDVTPEMLDVMKDQIAGDLEEPEEGEDDGTGERD